VRHQPSPRGLRPASGGDAHLSFRSSAKRSEGGRALFGSFSVARTEKEHSSHRQKDRCRSFCLCVRLLGYQRMNTGKRSLSLHTEGCTRVRRPDLSALLWSLVSPRDRTKSPYRFLARCRWGFGGTLGRREASRGALSHSRDDITEQRGWRSRLRSTKSFCGSHPPYVLVAGSWEKIPSYQLPAPSYFSDDVNDPVTVGSLPVLCWRLRSPVCAYVYLYWCGCS